MGLIVSLRRAWSFPKTEDRRQDRTRRRRDRCLSLKATGNRRRRHRVDFFFFFFFFFFLLLDGRRIILLLLLLDRRRKGNNTIREIHARLHLMLGSRLCVAQQVQPVQAGHAQRY
jgi:hypothetical protein